MHEQTRKFILLLIFFLFGPLLTLGIGTAAVLRKLPSNAARLEYELTKQTGVHWTVRSVEYRSPGVVRLEKVRIIDGSTNDTLFYAKEIYIKTHTVEQKELFKLFPNIDIKKQNDNGLLGALFRTSHRHRYYQVTVPLSLLTLEKKTPAEAEVVIKETLSKFLSRLPFLSETPMLFAFDDCFVQRSKTEQESSPPHLQSIKGNLYCTPQDVVSDWTFQLPPELEMQKFSLIKRRSNNDAVFTLRTGRRTIPCDIAGIFCDPFRQLGAEARFGGTFTVETGTASPVVRMESAVWRNVALAPLAAQYSPLTITGTVADLQIHKAVFGGGMFSAAGCTKITAGTLDKTLFFRLADHFRLNVNPPGASDATEQNVAFDGCAIHFKLQQDGIVFWGDEQWENGKLLMYRNGDALRTQPMHVLLSDEKRQPVPYYSVLSLFAPDDAPVVPLTPGLQRLVGSIPVIDSAARQQNHHPLVPATAAPMVAQPK